MADENKGPVPVSASALIRPGGTNFASMTDASQIDSLKAGAPSYHHEVDYKLKAYGKVRNPDPVTEPRSYTQNVTPKAAIKEWRTGTPVIHTETGKKLTIIQASIGHTKKTRTPVHRVADKEGNVYDIKESKLRSRM